MKVKISKQRAINITQDLESGFKVYVNKENGASKAVLNADSYGFANKDSQQEDTEEIDTWDFISIEPPQSYVSFEFMESFLVKVSDSNLQNELQDALHKRGPFAHFKQIVETSNVRHDWFVHNSECYINYLKRELEMSDIEIEDE